MASCASRPRRTAIVAAALAVSAALVVADDGRTPVEAAAPCALKGSKTLRSSLEVRIYEKRRGDVNVVYGCAYAVNRRYRLGLRGGFYEDKVDILALAGSHVAYISGYFGESHSHFTLYVKNLRTGAVRHDVEGEEHPSRVVLHPGGAVAWTTTSCLWDASEPLPGAVKFADECRYVVKADSAGAAVIDASLRIDLRSLRLTRMTVRWTTNGLAKSYVLTG